MWPWNTPARNLAELLGRGAGGASGDREVLQEGDYEVVLGTGFQMTPELLARATHLVKRLVVSFVRSPHLLGGGCPLWLFELRGLTGLCMNHYPWPTLPDEIGNLAELKHLHMYGSALTRLPRTLGCLRELRELDLYTSYGLHYLPIEVLACAQLSSSRFSTRALFNNCKTRLALPELPDWREAPDGTGVGALFGVLLQAWNLSDHLVQRVLTFLPRNRCSICSRRYLHDLGCNVWSHRVVGTDAQALLAFCCSKTCAASVTHQVRHDRASNCNERLEGSRWVSASTCPQRTSLTEQSFYRDFQLEHLRPWAKGLFTPAPTPARQPLELDQQSGAQVAPRRYRALHGGDVRLAPGSWAPAMGRLVRGDVLLAQRLQVEEDGREWLLCRRVGERAGLEGWTAMTKRDGLLKLVAETSV